MRPKQLKKLKHRHVVEIHDFGFVQDTDNDEGDRAYLVLQNVPGETLRQHVPAGQRILADEVKRRLSPIASALHYAHVSGIVHGNLHPGNLLIDPNDNTLLTDFSFTLQGLPFSSAQESTAIPYLAPEQLQGHPTAAGDQYALAVMVYELLCGQRPYSAAEREQLLHQQTHDPLPAPRSLNSDISPVIEQVLLQALAFNPDERFQHIQAFADNYLHALMGLPLNTETKRVVPSSLIEQIVANTIPIKNKTKASDEDITDKDTIKVVAQQKISNPSIPNVDANKKPEDVIPSTLYCNTCGGSNRKDAKYCFSCGQILQSISPLLQVSKVSGKGESPISPTLDCARCKSTNRADAKYCLTCGSVLQSATFTSQTAAKLVDTAGTNLLSTNSLLKQQYRIINQLGQGGMGTVYKAKDIKFDGSDRLVAVKALSQSDLNPKELIEATEDFKKEAHMLAGLRHPHLPRIYDYFDEGGQWYLVMEYIDGETLEGYLNKASGKRLPVEEVMYIGIQLSTVLEYLHNHEPSIIFRDLKPLNVMRAPGGHLYLIDFGIARHFKLGKAKDTTPLGTLGYAAPEQAGKTQTTHKSDIYSLGATLHQLLSGNDPSETPYQFAPLQLDSQSVTHDFGKLIMQMLARNVDERPDNITVINRKLQDIYAHWFAKQYNNHNKGSIKASMITGDSGLKDIVITDLCQGGVLSQSLSNYEERPAQIEMATLVAHSLTQGTPTIIEAGTGTGKALDVDTPIPTPTGWKRMGDLVEGDFVFDDKGIPTRVRAAFDVMYHRKCYEVVFSDGSSLIADAEHEWASYTCADRKWANSSRTDTYVAKNFVTSDQLVILDRLIALSENDNTLSVDGAVALIGGHHWSVYQAARKIAPINSKERPARYPHQALLSAIRGRLARDLGEQRRDGRTYSLVTTERMAVTLTVSSSPRANHAIAVAGPLALPDADLPIAPYFLGVWLGDGSSYNNQITSADPSLINEIEKDGYTVRSLKSHPYLYAVDDENGKAKNRWQPGMTGRLRALGLLHNKHIPAAYLRASEQQRRALLAGLLDTDGTVNHGGAIEFTTTSPRLAQDTYELMCSLGFRPSLRCGRARLRGKDCGTKWTLGFTTDEQAFRLERKAIAQKERLRNYSSGRNRFRYVVAVREVPSRPVRCIQVESQSHLYLAGRSMIPTHNSLAYLVPIVRSGKVAIISTANKALQEQLFYKDIPFVQQHIKHFDAALVKGIGNYVCIDRLESERTGMQFFAKNRDFTRLVDITNDPDAKFNGDFETLDFQLPADIRSKAVRVEQMQFLLRLLRTRDARESRASTDYRR